MIQSLPIEKIRGSTGIPLRGESSQMCMHNVVLLQKQLGPRDCACMHRPKETQARDAELLPERLLRKPTEILDPMTSDQSAIELVPFVQIDQRLLDHLHLKISGSFPDIVGMMLGDDLLDRAVEMSCVMGLERLDQIKSMKLFAPRSFEEGITHAHEAYKILLAKSFKVPRERGPITAAQHGIEPHGISEIAPRYRTFENPAARARQTTRRSEGRKRVGISRILITEPTRLAHCRSRK